MPDLIAQGTHNRERWRRKLPDAPESTVVIGRTGEATHGHLFWSVPWDHQISREHVSLTNLTDGNCLVVQSAQARNPVFYRGQKRSKFQLAPGEHFVIGHTTFTLALRPEVLASDPGFDVTEHVYDAAELRRRAFRDAPSRIDALGRLPDIIGGSSSDEELLVRVVCLLMQAISSATAVAVFRVLNDQSDPVLLHYDNRLPETEGPRPSARLVQAAANKRESVLHLWTGQEYRSKPNAAFTASEDVDWAFCVPIGDDAGEGWVIYVAGQLGSLLGGSLNQSMQAAPEELLDEVKFAELVAATVANLRQSRRLERRQMGMRRFFAPVVMEAMSGRDPEQVLQPRETEVSVLFCDLRGFTRQSEESQGQLLALLNRVSNALGVMTREILQTGGVVGDFHGDAAMGFWGWPLDQTDAVGRAAMAAMAIRGAFHQSDCDLASGATTGVLHGFRCGIGLATGRAVAGRIGTVDQVKVTAFGPVVNLASRLEGLTKSLAAEILIDDVSARWIRQHVPADQLRVRTLASIRPMGFKTAIEVSQLLPPAGTPGSPSEGDIKHYEEALQRLMDGQWDRAYELLHRVSAEDRAKDFLLATILRNGRIAPANWQGVIEMAKE